MSTKPAEDQTAPEIEEAFREVPESEGWRAEAPEPGEPMDLDVPLFEEGRLDNGMRVIVSRRPDLPLVSFSVAFLAGSASDPSGKGGLARLTYQLLLEGAGERDAMELADAFADLGTSPYTRLPFDGGLVGVSVLTRNANPALELLADMVRRPRLAEADFERQRSEQKANLTRLLAEPGYLSRVAIAKMVFGEDHPYGRLSHGTTDSLAALTLQDVQDFYDSHLIPTSAAFVATGDVDLDTAMEWAEAHFGDWRTEKERDPLTPAAPTPFERRRILVIERPGLQQTRVMLGGPALAVGDENEVPLRLASQVFGGMFGSRLNLNLREDKGFTYGAYSSAAPRRGVGLVSAGSAVETGVTGAALTEIFKELHGLRERPITDEELHAAREGFIRAIPGWFETVGALGQTGARLFWRDLPMNHYSRLVESLEAVTLEQIQDVAVRYFNPDTLQLVLVGDPEVVEEQVVDLDLGRLVSWEPGQPLPAAETD